MEFLSDIDIWLLGLVNGLAQKSFLFDKAVVKVSQLALVKGGFVVALMLYTWFAGPGGLARRPMLSVRALAGAIAAIMVGRTLQFLAPFRLRPYHDAGVDFVLPYGSNVEPLQGWSSFPSDHAVLYFAICTAIWFVERRLGFVAFVWTAVVIGFGRVYAGAHYPTDIAAGALLGILTMWAAFKTPVPAGLPQLVQGWYERHAPAVYVVVFLLAFQMASVFNDGRDLATFGWKALQMLTGQPA